MADIGVADIIHLISASAVDFPELLGPTNTVSPPTGTVIASTPSLVRKPILVIVRSRFATHRSSRVPTVLVPHDVHCEFVGTVRT